MRTIGPLFLDGVLRGPAAAFASFFLAALLGCHASPASKNSSDSALNSDSRWSDRSSPEVSQRMPDIRGLDSDKSPDILGHGDSIDIAADGIDIDIGVNLDAEDTGSPDEMSPVEVLPSCGADQDCAEWVIVKGVCELEVKAGYCVICGICLPEGARKAGSPCLECSPENSVLDWSENPQGADCEFGPPGLGMLGQCVQGTCCPKPSFGAPCLYVDCGSECGTECENKCAVAEICDAGHCVGQEGGCASDEECVDANPCSEDSCQDGNCVHDFSIKEECCTKHWDCATGGLWDDGLPETLDYCFNSVCVHALQQCTDCVQWDGYEVCEDSSPCTEDLCYLGCHCLNLWSPGCCTEDHHCFLESGGASYCELEGETGTCKTIDLPDCGQP